MADATNSEAPAVGGAPAETTNKYQGAISAWRSRHRVSVPLPTPLRRRRQGRGELPILTGPQPADLEFTALVSKLDNTASEIVAYQRDSTVQRKDLAQKTKDFRKLDDGAKLTEIKSLLKGMLVDSPSPGYNWLVWIAGS